MIIDNATTSKKSVLAQLLLVSAIIFLMTSTGAAEDGLSNSFDCSIYDEIESEYENDPNLGCTCILCLSNPEGPFAVEECHEPLCVLQKKLEDGEPFPGCGMGCDDSDNCKFVDITVAACISCEVTYGPGWMDYLKEEITETRHGDYTEQRKVCRKFLRYENVEVCEEEGNCELVPEPRYAEEPQRCIYALKIMYQGEQLGQTFYFERAARRGELISE